MTSESNAEGRPASVNTNKFGSLLFDFLSFLFILLSPFLVFIDNFGYRIGAANFFIVLGFSAIAAVFSLILRFWPSVILRLVILTILLLLFIDIQFDWIAWWGKKVGATAVAVFVILWILRAHVSRVIVVVFGTFIAATLGTSLLNYSLQDNQAQGPGPNSRKPHLPLYVHVILDEQMGIEGFHNDIPSHISIRREIQDFFAENKFRVFSRAYSQYFETEDSISSTLSLKPTVNSEDLYLNSEDSDSETDWRHSLINSSYFDEIIKMGYSINIYQFEHLDYCRSIIEEIPNCIDYKFFGASEEALSDLNGYEKSVVVLGSYGTISFFVNEAKKYYKQMRNNLGGPGTVQSGWVDWSGKLGPISTLPVFDRLIKDVSASPGGEMYFAHLAIPHYPYSVDSECKIRRPIFTWRERSGGPGDHHKKNNSPQSRLVRYEDYISQVQCAFLKLEKLMKALKKRGTFDDAIIIVHGDHGSRIVQVDPRIHNMDRLSRQDYFDSFSALYAVKSPAVMAGYDTRMMALPELLQKTLSGELDASAKSEAVTSPTVTLRGRNGTRLGVPMPQLPNTTR